VSLLTRSSQGRDVGRGFMHIRSAPMRPWMLPVFIGAVWLVPAGRADAQQAPSVGPATSSHVLANSTIPGVIAAYTTLISAGFEWRIDGDDNGNCTVALEYRRAGETGWRAAQPLLRVEHGIWTHGEDPGNLLAGSLFFLDPGTSYEARLTLSDPDGGADQRIVAFATRRAPRTAAVRTLYVVPGSGGGSGTATNPYRGLAAADAIAQPGDLFLLQPGTYHGKFKVTHDGTASLPITWRGVDAATVILDADGGTSSTSHCIDLTGRQHVIVEDMSLVNGLRPLNADQSTGITIRGCTIRPVNQLTGTQGIRAAYSTDLFIANNTIDMPGQWETIGRTGAYGTGGYAILIEGTGHVICHNTITEAWDAISIPVTGTGVPAWTTSNIDIYENFVDRASDDGIQADAIQHNVRIFHNRLLNTGSGISFQPAFGGPGYMLFNEMFNNRIEPYKFHQETFYGWTQETSGFVAFHNTSVCNRNGWKETGEWRHATFRNNLILGGRLNEPTFTTDYSFPGADFDYDGYNRVNGTSNLVRYGGASYPTLAAFYTNRGHEAAGVEVGLPDFVSAVLPHHPEWNYSSGYGAPYAVTDIDLRLSTASAAIDRGVPLANVNDGFSGSAPDLGCYERGRAVPGFGPRAPGATLSATVNTDVVEGVAPLSVRFTGSSSHANGIVIAYHWEFGDGSTAEGATQISHSFTSPGTYPVFLTLIDDDGAIATSARWIVVTDTADVPTEGARFALEPNLPNPFHGSTTIRFSLAEPAAAELVIFDVRGRIVRTLLHGALGAGSHVTLWDGRDDGGASAAPGIYFARLVAGDRTQTRRMTLVN